MAALMMLSVLLVVLGAAAATVRAETRETVNFDFAWRHSLDKSEWRHPQAALAGAPRAAASQIAPSAARGSVSGGGRPVGSVSMHRC